MCRSVGDGLLSRASRSLLLNSLAQGADDLRRSDDSRSRGLAWLWILILRHLPVDQGGRTSLNAGRDHIGHQNAVGQVGRARLFSRGERGFTGLRDLLSGAEGRRVSRHLATMTERGRHGR